MVGYVCAHVCILWFWNSLGVALWKKLPYPPLQSIYKAVRIPLKIKLLKYNLYLHASNTYGTPHLKYLNLENQTRHPLPPPGTPWHPLAPPPLLQDYVISYRTRTNMLFPVIAKCADPPVQTARFFIWTGGC